MESLPINDSSKCDCDAYSASEGQLLTIRSHSCSSFDKSASDSDCS